MLAQLGGTGPRQKSTEKKGRQDETGEQMNHKYREKVKRQIRSRGKGRGKAREGVSERAS